MSNSEGVNFWQLGGKELASTGVRNWQLPRVKNWQVGGKNLAIAMISKRIISKRPYLKANYLKQPRRQKPSQPPKYFDSDSPFGSKPTKAPGKCRSRARTCPDLGGFDFWNTYDIANAHEWPDIQDHLSRLALAVPQPRVERGCGIPLSDDAPG
jgi:hypothetical protein